MNVSIIMEAASKTVLIIMEAILVAVNLPTEKRTHSFVKVIRIDLQCIFCAIDIDECEEGIDLCDKVIQTCQNTIGGYLCNCINGLEKAGNGSCIGNG